MEHSQKYCLVHFIHPINTGAEFKMSDWPLHVTLVNLFFVDRQKTDIYSKLEQLLMHQPPVHAVALEEKILGVTPVVLVQANTGLMKLHETIMEFLEAYQSTFDTPEFTHNGYLPHSTIQKSGQLHPGERISVDSLSLVDMYPHNDWKQRKVLRTFRLGGKQL